MRKSRVVDKDLREITENLGNSIRRFEDKDVLISGGAGFLGKYLVGSLDYFNKNFLEKPCRITVMDNFIVGARDAFNDGEVVNLVEQDISKPFNFESDVNFVFHAASIASPMFYVKHRIETIDAGFLGTKNLLELSRGKNLESFLFFSSSEVYGNPDPKFVPTPETYNGNVSCTSARALYDEPKRMGETLCVTYGDIYKMPIKIVRPFNVFGPGMRLDDGRGIVNFVTSALKTGKIPVHGKGTSTRTWTYLTDGTTGFFQTILSEENLEAFNIGNDQNEIQNKDLARKISGMMGGKPEIEFVSPPNEAYGKAEVDRRSPNLKKARTRLGYIPRVNLDEGLGRFIDWAKEELAYS